MATPLKTRGKVMPRKKIKLSQAPLDVQQELKLKTIEALKHFPETQFKVDDNLSISWEGDPDPEVVREKTKVLVIKEKPQYFTKERREELKVSAREACKRINAQFPNADATFSCRYDSMDGSILIKYKGNQNTFEIMVLAMRTRNHEYTPNWNYRQIDKYK